MSGGRAGRRGRDTSAGSFNRKQNGPTKGKEKGFSYVCGILLKAKEKFEKTRPHKGKKHGSRTTKLCKSKGNSDRYYRQGRKGRDTPEKN